MAILAKFLTCFLMISQMATAQNITSTVNMSDKKPLSIQTLPQFQLFYFWATWCPDCKEKITSDLSIYKKPNLELIAIATDKDMEKVTDYLKVNKVAVPIYFDEKKELQKYFKVFSVPTVVLAEKNENSFRIIHQVTGTDWSEIKAKIKDLK